MYILIKEIKGKTQKSERNLKKFCRACHPEHTIFSLWHVDFIFSMHICMFYLSYHTAQKIYHFNFKI